MIRKLKLICFQKVNYRKTLNIYNINLFFSLISDTFNLVLYEIQLFELLRYSNLLVIINNIN